MSGTDLTVSTITQGQMLPPDHGNPCKERMLSTAEVSQMIGMSPRWLQRRIAAGTFPHVKFGRATRIRANDVQRLMASGLG